MQEPEPEPDPEPPALDPDPPMPEPEPPDEGETEEIRSPPGTPELEVAPMPSGVLVACGIEVCSVQWDYPWYSYTNHGLTRIYRSTANDFATATEIGTSAGISYLDETVRGEQTYFYWVVWETEAGNAGPAAAGPGSEPASDPADEIARLSDEVANDPFTWELTDTFWRTSAWLGDASLFTATIYDSGSVTVQGTLAGTNPLSGSAVWTGTVGAYDVRLGAADDSFGLARTPITGDARLEVDLSAATLDVDLTNFTEGHASMSWDDLALTNGEFDHATIEGAFYGAGHQGVAGEFDSSSTVWPLI